MPQPITTQPKPSLPLSSNSPDPGSTISLPPPILKKQTTRKSTTSSLSQNPSNTSPLTSTTTSKSVSPTRRVCEKCSSSYSYSSSASRNSSNKINEKDSNDQEEEEGKMGCADWAGCICGTMLGVICWSCTLSGEVKSHQEGDYRRGSSVTERNRSVASAAGCRCGKYGR